MGGGEGCLKKCIIMHVWDGFLQKVHYNALFGVGKKRGKDKIIERRDAEFAEKTRNYTTGRPVRDRNCDYGF